MKALEDTSIVGNASTERAPFYTPEVRSVRATILSPDLTIDEDWSIRIRRLEARGDEDPHFVFHLNNVLLPPNGLYPVGQRLTDRLDLVAALVAAIDQYLARCTNSKSRTRRVRVIFSEITYFFEYLWINDIINLRAVPKEIVGDCLSALGAGGWPNALRIRERVETINRKALLNAISLKKKPGGTENLKHLLHTNCSGRVTGRIGKELCDNVDRKGSRTTTNAVAGTERPAASTLVNSMVCINLLYDIGQPLGLSFIPFSKPAQIAEKIGRVGSRTRNIDISDCGAILREAMEWIYVRGPHVVGLLTELIDAVIEKKKISRRTLGRTLPNILQNSTALRNLEASLPFKIKSLDIRQKSSLNSSVRGVIVCLMSACFVVLASMNARRKDEILHRKYGLRRGDLKVIDSPLGLYEVHFYIEKTFRARTPYYVNQVSHDAFRLLEKIEEQFHRLHSKVPDNRYGETTDEERSLFSYRRFSVVYGVGNRRKWYDFATYSKESDAKQFVDLALGRNSDIVLAAHMFRRMYALIFFYRYENADLQSLSYQLGHFDLQTALIYISDPSSRPEMESIANRIGSPVRDRKAAHLEHVKGINAALLEAGEEKLGEDIYRIIAGEKFAGGYEKYVRRLQSKFASSVSFETASLEEQAEALFVAVKRRGHFPKPMTHGQCMVGNAINSKIARCFSKSDRMIHREDASANRCSTCPFHMSSVAHLRLLEREASHLRECLDGKEQSLQYMQGVRDLENLERAIELIRRRLN